MNKQNTIIAEPIINTDEQKKVGLCETSWVIVKASSDDKTEILYFNNDIDPLEYETFDNFVEINIDDFFCKGDNIKITKIIKENFATISGYDGSMEDDYDEESGKSCTIAVGTGAIIDFYKGGILQENLSLLIKKIHNDLENLESQGVFEAKDNYEFNKDPYKYHGVNRKDFM